MTGNNVGAIEVGLSAGPGSTVIGNSAHPRQEEDDVGLGRGISVRCPSTVIANTATGATENLVLAGAGCTAIGNTAP